MVRFEFVYLVYVDVKGLKLSYIYYYWFKSGYELSLVGKIKIFFLVNEEVVSMMFVFVLC